MDLLAPEARVRSGAYRRSSVNGTAVREGNLDARR